MAGGGHVDQAGREHPEGLEETVEAGRIVGATVRRPTEMAGLTYREMLRELRGRNVPFPQSREELGMNDITGMLGDAMLPLTS